MSAAIIAGFSHLMNNQRMAKTPEDIYANIQPCTAKPTTTKNQQVETQSNTNIVNGFIVDSSKTKLAKSIFETYPETVENVQSQNDQVRTYYMNVLFRIHDMLYNKKKGKFSNSELREVTKGLSNLTRAGFEVGWLRSKLDEMVSLERKERDACEARIVELEQEMKKLEVMKSDLKVELKKVKAKSKLGCFWGSLLCRER